MSRVIRSKSRVIERDVVSAHLSAEQILANAERQAAQIVEEAERQAATVTSNAESIGAQAAKADATVMLQKIVDKSMRALTEAEDTIVALAIEVASRVVREVAEENPNRIREVVRGLLKRAERATKIIVFVNPNDVAQVSTLISDDLAFDVEADGNLAVGECLLKTEIGDFDARFDIQLQTLETALLAK